MAPYMVRCKVQKTSRATFSETDGAQIEGIFPTYSVAGVGALGFGPERAKPRAGFAQGFEERLVLRLRVTRPG